MFTSYDLADFDEILHTIRQAKQGNAQAQFDLALRFQTGNGVPQDEAETEYWFQQAAQQGHPKAQQYLKAQQFLSNIPAIKNKQDAKNLKSKGSVNPQAQYQLSMNYLQGKGLPPDPRQAINWLRKAARQGHKEAQYQLGMFYKQGQWVRPNDDLALLWLRRAASQGYVKALATYFYITRRVLILTTAAVSAVAVFLFFVARGKNMGVGVGGSVIYRKGSSSRGIGRAMGGRGG